MNDKSNLISSAFWFSLIFTLIMWVVFLIDLILPVQISIFFGIHPRDSSSIFAIFLHPFLHSSFQHLINNSKYVLPLLFILGIFYEKLKYKVIIYSIIASGVLLFLFGREGRHIGASGLIFSVFGFLIVSGLFRKSILHMVLSMFLFIVFGSTIYLNMISFSEGVSTEGHIFGLLSGMIIAYEYRKEPAYEFKKQYDEIREGNDDTTDIC